MPDEDLTPDERLDPPEAPDLPDGWDHSWDVPFDPNNFNKPANNDYRRWIFENDLLNDPEAYLPMSPMLYNVTSPWQDEIVRHNIQFLYEHLGQGTKGPKGDKGDKGDPGPEGPQGPTGPEGPQGPAGPEGPEGPQGLEGPEGPQGPAGADGADGQDGSSGADGDSAYDIYVNSVVPPDVPMSEDQWLLSLKGEQGETGAGLNLLGDKPSVGDLPTSGAPGDGWLVNGDLWVWDDANGTWVDVGNIQGPEGPEGPAGQDGLEGPEGPQGPAGPEGPQGPEGPEGPQGPDGADGADGADGDSAYEVWLGQGNTGTEQDFLDSLIGPEGPVGPGGGYDDTQIKADIAQNATDIGDHEVRILDLETNGGGGGADPLLEARVKQNEDDIGDHETRIVANEERLDIDEPIIEDHTQRLDALEALDPYDDSGLVSRLDQIDADQIVQDDDIAQNVADIAAIQAEQIVQNDDIAQNAADIKANADKNVEQDGRLDKLENSVSKTAHKYTPTNGTAGFQDWKAGEVWGQEGSHHDLTRMSTFTFPEFDLDGDDTELDDVTAGAILVMENDAGDKVTCTVESIVDKGTNSAGQWYDVKTIDRTVVGDTNWQHWRHQNFTATFTNVTVDLQPEIDRIDAEQIVQNDRLDDIEPRLDDIETEQIDQNNRLDALESAQDELVDRYNSVDHGSIAYVKPGRCFIDKGSSTSFVNNADYVAVHPEDADGDIVDFSEVGPGWQIRVDVLTTPGHSLSSVISSVTGPDGQSGAYKLYLEKSKTVVIGDERMTKGVWWGDPDDVFIELTLDPSAEIYDDTELRGLIADNATDIAGIQAEQIVQNDDIAQNKSDIAQNVTDIAQNESDIAQNATDIAQNKSDIAQNATDIAQNVTDIAQNKSDIAANAKALGDHEEDHDAHRTLVAQPDPDDVLLPDENGDPRVGRLFRCFSSMPVGFESTGSYKPLIGLYRYAQGAPAGRELALDLHANGRINRHVALDEPLRVGDYVWKEALDIEIAAAIDAIPDSTLDLAADYDWTGKHEWRRTGDNLDDWIIYGRSKAHPDRTNEKVLSVFRNSAASGNPDAVNYTGKDDSNNNLCNVGRAKELISPLQSEIDDMKQDLADALAGAITHRSWEWVSTTGAAIQDGKFWTNSQDQWSRLTALRVSDVDSGGKSFPIDIINDSDVLEMIVLSGGAQQGRGVLVIDNATVVQSGTDRAVDITVAGWQVQEGRPPGAGDICLFAWIPSTSEFATEAYVDSKIAAIDIPDHPELISLEYVAKYMGMNSSAWGNQSIDDNKFAAYQKSNLTTTSNWWGNMEQFRFTSNTGEVPKTLTSTTGIHSGTIIISEWSSDGAGEIRWKGGASWGSPATVQRVADYRIWFNGGHKVMGHGSQAVVGKEYHISVVGYPLMNPVR